MFKQVAGFDGIFNKRKIIVAHSFNAWNEDCGYGVLTLCENYKNGKTIKTWRYITKGQSKDAAIAHFNKINKS